MTDTNSTLTVFDRATLFFNIVPTVSYSFSPAMNKNLDAMLIQIAPAP